MSQLKIVLTGLIPLLLLIVIVQQVQSIMGGFHRDKPEYQQVQESFKESVSTIEKAQDIIYQDVDSTFEPVGVIPFGNFYTPRRRGAPTPRYDRVSLTLQGVLQGEMPIAVVIDPQGKTHFLKEGESLLERTVQRITTNGVVIRDRAGTETITVQ